MTAFLRRIACWWRETSVPMRPCPPRSASPRAVTCYSPESCMGEDAYLADFGPNVPVEDLGGKPAYFENNLPNLRFFQPAYPGREKAP